MVVDLLASNDSVVEIDSYSADYVNFLRLAEAVKKELEEDAMEDPVLLRMRTHLFNYTCKYKTSNWTQRHLKQMPLYLKDI